MRPIRRYFDQRDPSLIWPKLCGIRAVALDSIVNKRRPVATLRMVGRLWLLRKADRLKRRSLLLSCLIHSWLKKGLFLGAPRG